MKNQITVFCLALCQSLMSLASIASSSEEIFQPPLFEFYGETLWRQDARTFDNSQALRAHLPGPRTPWEFYGIGRWKGDTRTLFSSTSAVLSDAALFLGAGVDWLGLAPGVRLTLQTGYSFDLSSKINKAGFDARLGWLSYHEQKIALTPIRWELYTEGLWEQRQKAFAPTMQPRLYWEALQQNGWSLGPLSTFVASATFNEDASLFSTELRLGARVTYQSQISFGLYPHYSLLRTHQKNQNQWSDDWRGLAYLAASF